MEMLSEHTLEGWFEGYVLTGRHGFFSTYEAFVHVIDSMFNQHAKWLEKAKHELDWRAPISSLNLLITSLVWRQDHNGFTHQDPGFLDVVTNKSPECDAHLSAAGRELPAERGRSLPAQHELRERDRRRQAAASAVSRHGSGHQALHQGHRHLGLGQHRRGQEPDVVMACAGDIATWKRWPPSRSCANSFPDLKIRFVNVVDLFRLLPDTEHPHGLSDRDFDSLFTADKPVIFNFHAYPSLIHKLTYRRTNHDNIHVRGYKEKGNINTPLELAILNQVDRFNLAIDVIDRVPKLQATGRARQGVAEGPDHRKHQLCAHQKASTNEIRNWKWPL